MNLKYSANFFDDLTVQDLHALLKLRTDIFVVEQQCAYAEIDGRDPVSWHVLGKTSDGELVAYARIIPREDDGLPHIGRVVVRKDHRGKGHAHHLMEFTLGKLNDLFGSMDAEIAAQVHLERFYERHGFKRKGAEYPWDGIPHVDMVRLAKVSEAG